jgi:oligopeptide transport system substrate-binding protein
MRLSLCFPWVAKILILRASVQKPVDKSEGALFPCIPIFWNFKQIRFMRSRIIVLACLTALIGSCGHKQKQKDTRTVFRYNEPGGLTSLDPAFARTSENTWAVNQVFNGLVQLDEKLNVKPCIAYSWDISEDGLEYKFHLRNDVYFHNDPHFKGGKGRKVVASDFVNSFYRIINPEVASPGAWIFNNIDLSTKSNRQGFIANDDSTLTVYLKKSFPPFLSLLAMQYCSVVPSEVVEYYGHDFRNHPVGTGPFRFKLWKEGEKLILLKNENYFEKDKDGNRLPYLDAVAVSFIKDRQTGFLEFVKGNFDFLSGVDGSFKDDILTAKGELNPKYNGKFRMDKSPYLKTDYMGILVDPDMPATRQNPLLKKYVRQAINYGFDRKKMISFLKNNIGKPATSGFVPYGMPSFDENLVKGYIYDPDYARELLKKAGYPNGNGLPTIMLTTTSMYQDLCEFMQSELKEIGIKVKVDVVAPAPHSEMVARGDVAFFRKSWIADYPDAENYLALFYSKNFAPAGPNYTHFKNAAYDALYEKAQQETNTEKRFELYREMDKIVIEEAPVVPLYYDEAVTFSHNNISGLQKNPLNMLVLKTVKKSR